MSVTDWLNSQCADRLISAVLIGHHPRSTGAILQANTTEAHQCPHSTYKEPYTQRTHIHTYNAQYILPHTMHTHKNCNQVDMGSPVTSRPLNGHFAITLFPPIRTGNLNLALLKSLTLLISILSTLFSLYPLFWVVSWASRMHNFVIGRTSSVPRKRTRAERTRLSVPLYVSMIRPTGQLLRGRCLPLGKKIRSHHPGNPLGMYWKRIKPS